MAKIFNKTLNQQKNWRPVANTIVGILLATLLSLIVNMLSGFEKITPLYGTGLACLLAALIVAGTYSWKQTETQEKILEYRSINKDKSIIDLDAYENNRYKDIQRKMRLWGFLAWFCAIVGGVLFAFDKFEARQINITKEREHQSKEDKNNETITKKLSELREQVNQLKGGLDNLTSRMPQMAPTKLEHQRSAPKKSETTRERGSP